MLYRSSSSSRPQPRQGVVLVAVLIVVTVLALAAYQYSELMAAEYKAADSNMRAAQTRRAAFSGIQYCMAILSDPTFVSSTLNYNPYDNPQYFQDILIQDDTTNTKRRLHFTILALRAPDDPLFQSQPYRFGVEDEAGKLNLNALLKYDKSGTIGLQMLTATNGLPNMTDTAANSLLDWLDGTSSTARSGGAKDDYYMGLTQAYHCKNGPLDSLDELLYVQGFTSDLLWGNDLNFNGQFDPGEVGGNGTGGVDRGWAPYLTIFSREANVSSTGQARVYINDPSISTLQTNMTTAFSNGQGNSQDLINFILAYRMYGPAASTSTSASGAKNPKTTFKALTGNDQQAAIAQISADVTKMSSSSSSGNSKLTSISSLYSLITASVSVQVKTGTGNTAKTQTITLPSPLANPSEQAILLPLLLDLCTTSQNTDLTARINVNTASETVLMTLVKDSNTTSGTTTATTQTTQSSGLQTTDVLAIIAKQPQYTGGNTVDPTTYSTPAWLITQANLAPATVQSLEPFITARSTVYRFQVLGYFEGGGPVTRLEAVIDTNYGRPRLVYLRNLTELGKVYDMSQIQLSK